MLFEESESLGNAWMIVDDWGGVPRNHQRGCFVRFLVTHQGSGAEWTQPRGLFLRQSRDPGTHDNLGFPNGSLLVKTTFLEWTKYINTEQLQNILSSHP